MSADQAERPSLKAARALTKTNIADALNFIALFDVSDEERSAANLVVERKVAEIIARETSCDTLSTQLEEARREAKETRGLLRRAMQNIDNSARIYYGLGVGNSEEVEMALEIQKFLGGKGGV